MIVMIVVIVIAIDDGDSGRAEAGSARREERFNTIISLSK